MEFAIQRRAEGMSVIQAAIEGAVARLRPILMTSFAFIAGLIPLCIATGAGAVGNRTIGTAAAGGMLMGTLVRPGHCTGAVRGVCGPRQSLQQTAPGHTAGDPLIVCIH